MNVTSSINRKVQFTPFCIYGKKYPNFQEDHQHHPADGLNPFGYDKPSDAYSLCPHRMNDEIRSTWAMSLKYSITYHNLLLSSSSQTNNNNNNPIIIYNHLHLLEILSKGYNHYIFMSNHFATRHNYVNCYQLFRFLVQVQATCGPRAGQVRAKCGPSAGQVGANCEPIACRTAIKLAATVQMRVPAG